MEIYFFLYFFALERIHWVNFVGFHIWDLQERLKLEGFETALFKSIDLQKISKEVL